MFLYPIEAVPCKKKVKKGLFAIAVSATGAFFFFARFAGTIATAFAAGFVYLRRVVVDVYIPFFIFIFIIHVFYVLVSFVK
jgi:hypothetical protein